MVVVLNFPGSPFGGLRLPIGDPAEWLRPYPNGLRQKGPPKARTCFFRTSSRHLQRSALVRVFRRLRVDGRFLRREEPVFLWTSAELATPDAVMAVGTWRAKKWHPACRSDDGTLRPFVRRGHPASPSRVVEVPSVPQSAFRVRPVLLFASKRRRSATPRWSGEGTGRSTSRFVGTLLPSSLRDEIKRGVVPGTRCLPRRMDPPSSRHPGCRRDVATLCRRPRTACSRSLARQQRRRAVRCVVGVGDVSLWDYVVATRASCLSRFEAKRCCGATL